MPMSIPLSEHVCVGPHLRSPGLGTSLEGLFGDSIGQRRLELRRGEHSLQCQAWDFSAGGASCFVVSAQRQTTHIVDTRCSRSDTCSHHPVLAVTQVGAVPLQLRRLPGRVSY